MDMMFAACNTLHLVWLALFSCICSHSLELTSSQRSFLWISCNFPETP